MRNYLLPLATLLFFLPNIAYAACSCPEKSSLEQALEKSSVVFLGRVEEQNASPLKPGYLQIKFSVLRRFKSVEDLEKAQLVTIYTPIDEAQCGYKFQNGFDYVIFASGNPAFLKVTSCSRTEVLEKATVDQQKLIRLTGTK